MGSDPDHLVEALEEVFGSQSTEEQDTQEDETTSLAPSCDPDDYYVDLEISSSFSKHFNNICVITLGRMTGTTFQSQLIHRWRSTICMTQELPEVV